MSISKSNKTFGIVTVERDPIYPKELTTKRYVDAKISTGDVKYSVRNTDHDGWMLCDGRSLTRTEYPELFDVIGTAFGSSSGTTFNLPNCQGRVLGAIGQGSGLTNRSLGASVGAETHTLTVGEIPSHTHSINDPGHTHSYVNQIGDQNTDNAFASETAADQADYNQTTGSSTTGITIQSTGGGGAHNNMQPTLFIGNVFIFSSLDFFYFLAL